MLSLLGKFHHCAHRGVVLLMGLIFLGGLAGCQPYQATFVHAFRYGDYPEAVLEVQSEGHGALTSEGHSDRLIYLLEQGAVMRAAGQLEQSNQSLDEAEKLFEKFDEKAKVRIGREAMAAVTNLAELNYEGYGYDRIMMNAYKALNYIELGNMDYARVELKRVAYAQQANEQRKQEKIAAAEAARQEKDNSATSVDAQRTYNDPQLQAQISNAYADLPDLTAKAVYVNAYAEYLQGLFMLHAGDTADREIGRTALRNTAGMIANTYVQQDVELAEQLTSGGGDKTLTYVIVESGLAPRREELRIDIPIFIFNIVARDTGVDYVGAAFPILMRDPEGYNSFSVRGGGADYPAQLLVDMDGVVAREFKDELPAVITRTIIAAGTKAVLAYAANRATARNDLLNLATRIGTTAYQMVANRADLRTWRTLPKNIYIMRLPTPADGQLALLNSAGGQMAAVQVDPNAVNLVWVRSPSEFGQPACRVMRLKMLGSVKQNSVQGAKS